MISMKGTKKLLDNVLDMLPIARRSSALSPYVIGAIGVALVGGIAAVMILSPRTRYRVLGAAKDTYGKIKEPLTDARVKLGMQGSQPNGLASSYGSGVSPRI